MPGQTLPLTSTTMIAGAQPHATSEKVAAMDAP